MNSGSQKRFAGFIITFRRPDILSTTIDLVLSQTRSPEKLLIIDNGDEADTRLMIQSKNDSRLVYFSPGSNLGPAGAAALGLDLLAREGFQWIFWGDDNDPPKFEDAFSMLLSIPSYYIEENIGILGSVGQRFSKLTGNYLRIPDKELVDNKIIWVNSVAGGHCMIVNSNLIKKNILPDASLFFGFEELDFCFKAMSAGYTIVVDCDLFYRSRMSSGRLNYRQPVYFPRPESTLVRQYYSSRNLLIILKRNSLYLALTYQFLKLVIKAFYGYRYGLHYGLKNMTYLLKGIFDFLVGIRGAYYSMLK